MSTGSTSYILEITHPMVLNVVPQKPVAHTLCPSVAPQEAVDLTTKLKQVSSFPKQALVNYQLTKGFTM
jgi:hypothetical protein